MQSNKKRIRKDFAPLTVAYSIRCVSAAAPLTQVYNGALNEYEPDREITPTVILPDVTANASDGSWGDPHANRYLADMHWYVNAVDIATLPDWNGKYVIEQNGDERGQISISKNISPGDAVTLHFEASLPDNRLGVNIPIITDSVVLSTSEKADDGYSVSLTDANLIQYDPVKDRLALYDYKVAHGLIPGVTAVRNTYIDKCSFIHEIPFTVYHGKDPISSGYTAKLYKVLTPTSLGQMSVGGEVESLTGNKLVLDLRMIEQVEYVLKIFVGTKEVASTEIGVSRIYQKCHGEPTNGTAIHPLDTERYDQAMVSCDGNVVECPGSIYRIVWYTDTDAKTGVEHNEGDTTVFQLSKTGIGDTEADDWCEVYFTTEYKPAYKTATEGQNVWTDENGNPYIFR